MDKLILGILVLAVIYLFFKYPPIPVGPKKDNLPDGGYTKEPYLLETEWHAEKYSYGEFREELGKESWNYSHCGKHMRAIVRYQRTPSDDPIVGRQLPINAWQCQVCLRRFEEMSDLASH